jgi:UDP-glucose 4-epimerase
MDLVTGGCGFIGSHLAETLVRHGRNVRVLDNLAVGRAENLDAVAGNDRLELIVGDISDPQVCRDAMASVRRVYHLAARADIVPSIDDPDVYFQTNVVGTFNLLQAARETPGLERFIYAASSSRYGIPDQAPTPEGAAARPQYPYALTKDLGEQTVLHWAQVYKMPATALRFFNVYGPRARTSGGYGAVFGVFLAQLLAGEPLTIVGDGTQKRDFTHVRDIVRAIMTAAERDLTGMAFNVGTGNPVSVNRIVELLGAERTVRIPKRPGEPDVTCADIGAFAAASGWAPEVTIEEGVADLLANIEYWREAPVWTSDKIADATRNWFKYLGEEPA